MENRLTLTYKTFFNEETDHPLLTRVLAFIVDFIILFAIGTLVYFGLIEFGLYSKLNQLIVDVGIWIACLSLANSKFYKGQTIGKKLFRLSVVDRNAEYLTLPKAFVRSVPIVLAVNSFQIISVIIWEASSLYIPAFYGLSAILFGIPYFMLLNRNRQGLHDMLVGSQVISFNKSITIERKISWGLIVGFVLIVATYVTLMLNYG